MSDKPEFGKSEFSDFQSALESVGAEAMEQAIDTAYKQLMAEEASGSQNAESSPPEHLVSSAGNKLKKVSIEQMEEAVAVAFSDLTGDVFTCSVKGVVFENQGQVNLDLSLKIDKDCG